MDIQAIIDNIDELENNATTPGNVQELASLYIVQEHLQKRAQSVVELEINDILPSYRNYVAKKTEFQLGHIEQETVLHSLKLLCQETREFLLALYGSSHSYKERRVLNNMLESVMLQTQQYQ